MLNGYKQFSRSQAQQCMSSPSAPLVVVRVSDQLQHLEDPVTIAEAAVCSCSQVQ